MIESVSQSVSLSVSQSISQSVSNVTGKCDVAMSVSPLRISIQGHSGGQNRSAHWQQIFVGTNLGGSRICCVSVRISCAGWSDPD